jgi:hypothetical protein
MENKFKAKYLRNKFVASVEARLSDSPSWKALFQEKILTSVAPRIVILNI